MDQIKKRNRSKMRRKRAQRRRNIMILCIIAMCLITGVVGCTIARSVTSDSGQHQSKDPGKDPAVSGTEVLKDIKLNSELIKVSSKGDTAKIDIVQPGLDTCSMRVVLYDIQTDQVLSETTLDEGAWITGLTDQGFYAVDQYGKTVFLYDRSGKVINEKSFDGSADWTSVCAVSDDENYFVYTDAPDGKIHIFDMTTGQDVELDTKIIPMEQMGVVDNQLYILSMNREVCKIDMENADISLVMNDIRLTYFTPFYSIGTTEYNFLAVTEDSVSYIPFTSVDEYIVGINAKGFSTTVSSEDGEILRLYDLKDQTVAHMSINDTVESVCLAEDGRYLVVCGNSMEKKHRIYICDPNTMDKEAMIINDSDVPYAEDIDIQISGSEPAEQAVIIEDVPIICQYPEYPTGCESVSAVMVLNYMGEDMTAEEFIDDYLPKNAEFYMDGDKKYGPSPYEYFIGNPRTSASYGCMASVIESALEDYFGSDDRIVNATDSELSYLCKTYIDQDIPVLVWATMNMIETEPENTWYLSDGTRFTWPGNEHCLVLVGYDESDYYFNDPYSGMLVKYDRELAEERYAELGSQSLVITR